MDRILPQRKGRAAPFPVLPPVKTTGDIVNALASLTEAVTSGQISTEEALQLSGVLEVQRKAIEQQVMEAQMATFEAELEARFPKK
jgi:hypothetical protein